MIDIHAHLHDAAFDLDRDEAVRRAKEAGVEKIITIGTDVEESRKAVSCAEQYENVYASVGIHPEFFNEIEENTKLKSQRPNKTQNSNHKFQEEIEELRELARHSKVMAIGECGLDYYARSEQGAVNNEQRTKSEEQGIRGTADAPAKGGQAVTLGGTTVVSERQKAFQKEGFIAQIELASELQLPLIIHCRPSIGTVDAYEDLFLILKSSIVNLESAILHCYMGDTEVTKKFLELSNVYFSFTGNITYVTKKVLTGTKDDLTEVVKMIPIQRLLAETDCPYLAPVPYRGKRNEPAYMTLVFKKIAEIKEMSLESVEQTINMSVKKIFAL